MFNRNPRTARFHDFLRRVDADVIAFQELTAAHVTALQSLPGHRLTIAKDFREGEQLTYLGILSRLPAAAAKIVAHNAAEDVSPSWLGRRMQWRECLESQSLDVTAGATTVRLVNLHLTCAAPPRVRHAQLTDILHAHLPADRPALVCGDFNAFASPAVNLVVGWVFGCGWRDIFANDVAAIDRIAARGGGRRISVNAVTYPRWRLRLDHIISYGLSCVSYTAIGDTFGSDHRPLVAEIEG